MNHFAQVCVLVALAGSIGCVCADDLRDLFTLRLHPKDFEDLNRYLEANVGNEYPMSNIEAAQKFLERSSDERSLGYFKKGGEKAAERFVALKRIWENKMCDQESYVALKDTLNSGAKRIVGVARQVAVQHAVTCLPIYKKAFLEEYDRKRAGKIPNAEFYTNFIDQEVGFHSAIRSYVCDPKNGSMEKCYNFVGAAILTLMAPEDPTLMRLLRLVDRGVLKMSATHMSSIYYIGVYLDYPCKEYLHKYASNSLAANIVDPAELDIFEFPKTEPFADSDEERFYRALWTIRFCRTFTHNASKRQTELAKAVPFAIKTYEDHKVMGIFEKIVNHVATRPEKTESSE